MAKLPGGPAKASDLDPEKTNPKILAQIQAALAENQARAAAGMQAAVGGKGEGIAKTSDEKSQSILSEINKTLKQQNRSIENLTESIETMTTDILDALKGGLGGTAPSAPPAAGGEGGAAPAAAQQAKGPGFLGDVTKFLGPIEGLITGLIPVLEGIGTFALEFAGPIAILVGIFASLKQQDWAKFFDGVIKVFDDLMNGDWVKALTDGLGAIGGLLLTGLGRLVANILSFFGFDNIAKEINDWLDSVDLVKVISDFLDDTVHFLEDAFTFIGRKIGQYIDIFTGTIGSVFGSFFDSISKEITDVMNGDILGALIEGVTMIPNMIIKGVGTLISKILTFFGFEDTGKAISDYLSTFNLAEIITGWINLAKDAIVGAFNTAMDTVNGWIASAFKLGDDVIAWFTNLYTDVTNLFNGFYKDISDWWKNFDVVAIITDTFQNVQNMIFDYFGGLGDRVKNVFSDMGKAVSEWASNLASSLNPANWSIFGGGKKEAPAAAPQFGSYKEAQIAKREGKITQEQLTAWQNQSGERAKAMGNGATTDSNSTPLSPYETSNENVVDLLEQIRKGKEDGSIPPGNAKQAIQALKQGDIKLAKKWMDVSRDTTGGDPFSGPTPGPEAGKSDAQLSIDYSNKFGMPIGIPNKSTAGVAAASAENAKAMSSPPAVIVNNNVVGGGAQSSPPPRQSSGMVITKPDKSDLDFALFGFNSIAMSP